MVNPYSQWLFVITDETDPSIFLPTIDDGQNISFLYNTSKATNSSTHVQQNLTCYASTLFDVYVKALHQVIRAEETQYFQTTEDDWSRSKPSAGDRSNEVYRTLLASPPNDVFLYPMIDSFSWLISDCRICGNMPMNVEAG